MWLVWIQSFNQLQLPPISHTKGCLSNNSTSQLFVFKLLTSQSKLSFLNLMGTQGLPWLHTGRSVIVIEKKDNLALLGSQTYQDTYTHSIMYHTQTHIETYTQPHNIHTYTQHASTDNTHRYTQPQETHTTTYHTQIYTYRYTKTHIYNQTPHTQIHTHRHTKLHQDTHTHTIHTHRNIYTHTATYHMHIQSHTTYRYTHTDTHRHTNSHKDTHTHTIMYHTQTHIQRHTHTTTYHTHMHTQPHITQNMEVHTTIHTWRHTATHYTHIHTDTHRHAKPHAFGLPSVPVMLPTMLLCVGFSHTTLLLHNICLVILNLLPPELCPGCCGHGKGVGEISSVTTL